MAAIAGQEFKGLYLVLGENIHSPDFYPAFDQCIKQKIPVRLSLSASTLEKYVVFMNSIPEKYRIWCDEPLVDTGSTKDIFSFHQVRIDSALMFFGADRNEK
jgi:hypothetical protein